MKSPLKFLLILICNICNINSFIFNLPQIDHDLAISLVKTTTKLLPQFDSVGHYVLHANEVLINRVLEMNIDPVQKKKLILQIIDMSRKGDEMGGKILDDYYNFVNKLL